MQQHERSSDQLWQPRTGEIHVAAQQLGSPALHGTIDDYAKLWNSAERAQYEEPGIVTQLEAAIPQERAGRLFELPETLRANKQAERKGTAEYAAYMEGFMNPMELAAHKSAQEDREALGTKVTDVSRREAGAMLATATWMDAKLQKIIYNFQEQTGLQDLDKVVDAIRTNKQLRLAVGKHFLAKTHALVQEHTVAVPSRVVRNAQKKPKGLAPVPNLTSSEYVSLLCVAMVDGTFDSRQAQSDPVVRKGTEVEVGQHRVAANMVLKNYKINEDGSSSPFWYGN